ncbi:MAG TPA: CrcB family protein [bacterium]|nr:CrcB family protein [bacterium]
MEKYLYIGLGAVLGAYCRFWAGAWATERWGTDFVYGTLMINVVGSFVLALFLTLNLDRQFFSTNIRFLVAVGWCASFTTYSTFSWDSFRYIQQGNMTLAFVNMGATLVGCLVATWAGVVVGRLI